MTGRKLMRKSGRFLIYFFIVSLIVIGGLFGIYFLFLGQAFADRGVSENVMPAVVTVGGKSVDVKYYNDKFICSSESKVVDLPPSSVGMFPLLLRNTKNTCNKATDFIGVERFLDAFLYGEAGIASPAKSSSRENPFLTHHPGLRRLRKLARENIPLDRSNAFFWWMFPLPIATPSRGFTYALFWGDFLELQTAASRRGLDFVELFGEGIDLTLSLNGRRKVDEKEGKEADIHKFNEQDHVFVKAYMSLQCIKLYTNNDQRLLKHELALKAFMKEHIIRYPSDYKCSQ